MVESRDFARRLHMPHLPFDRFLIALCFGFFLGLSGCGSTRSGGDESLRAQAREVLGQGANNSSDSMPSDGQGGSRSGSWTIFLESQGRAELNQVQRRLEEVRALLGRGDVKVRTTPSGSALTLGSYRTYRTPVAKEDLKAVRAVIEGRMRPFARAFLAPPREERDPGRLPELNLATARSVYGEKARYTLQIAVYESEKPKEAKRAAEEAALVLRQDGQLAFYHHGPHRSMVTVGVFAESDLDERLRPRSAALVALMKEYPTNLLNGQYPIIERNASGQSRTQPSTLVRIP